jgi:hypothetical protein
MSIPTLEGVPETIADDIRLGTGRSQGGLDSRGTGYDAPAASFLDHSLHATCGRLRAAHSLVALEASEKDQPRHQTAPVAPRAFDTSPDGGAAYGGLTGPALLAAIDRDRNLLKFELQQRAIALSGKLLEARRRVVTDIRTRYAREADITDLAQALPIMIAARQDLPLPLTAEKSAALNLVQREDLRTHIAPVALSPDAKPATEREAFEGLVMVYGRGDRRSRSEDSNATLGAAYTMQRIRGVWAPDWRFESMVFDRRARAIGMIYGDRSVEEHRKAIYLAHPVALLLPHYESHAYELADTVRLLDVAERNARLRRMIDRLCRDLDDANRTFARDIADPRRKSASRTLARTTAGPNRKNTPDWTRYRPLLEAAALDLYRPGDPAKDPLYPVVMSIANELEPFDWLSAADQVLMVIGIAILVGVFLQVEFAAAIPLLVDIGGAALTGWRYWETIEASERASTEQQFTQIDHHLLTPIEQASSVDSATLAFFMSLFFVVAGVGPRRPRPPRPAFKPPPGDDVSGRLGLAASDTEAGAVGLGDEAAGRLGAPESPALTGEGAGDAVLDPAVTRTAAPANAVPSVADEMSALPQSMRGARSAALQKARGTDQAARLDSPPTIAVAEVTPLDQRIDEMFAPEPPRQEMVLYRPPPAATEPLDDTARAARLGAVPGYPLVSVTHGADPSAAASLGAESTVPVVDPTATTASEAASTIGAPGNAAQSDRLGGIAGSSLVSVSHGVVDADPPAAASLVAESTAPAPGPAVTTATDPAVAGQAGSLAPFHQATEGRRLVTFGETSYSFKKSASYYPGVPWGHRITVRYKIEEIVGSPGLHIITFRFRASEFTSIGMADWMDRIRERYAIANEIIEDRMSYGSSAYVLTKSQLEKEKRRSERFASGLYDPNLLPKLKLNVDLVSELKLNVDEMLSLAFSGEAFEENQMYLPFAINQIVSKADGAIVRWARSQGNPNDFHIFRFVVEFE